MKDFTIIGGGLVGALQGIFLAQKGYKVKLYERRPDIRTTNIYQGRSINLALSDRGWKALDKVQLSNKVRSIGIPMYRRTMHDKNGNLTFQPYGKEDQAIFSVSRGELNKQLLSELAKYENVELYFNERCTGVDFEKQIVHFKNEQTGISSTQAYNRLIGADGAFSAVRTPMIFGNRFNYDQNYTPHGYKELHMFANDDGSHKMDVETLHIWPREDFMLIALPNLDGSFTCTLFMHYEGRISFESIKTEPEIIAFFETYFPDVIPLIPDFIQQFLEHPVSNMVTVKCGPWNVGDHTLLIGDAAHAIVPFYAQGMNAGFEDCSILSEMMDSGNFEQSLFSAFAKNRKADADAIADLAMQNFVEMRDKTADPEFLLQKKIEAKFYKSHPDKWMPLYSMVTFSNIPYSEAMARGQYQDKIMQKIMAMPQIEHIWESEEVEKAILAAL